VKNLPKKYTIKIPNDTFIFYNNEKKIIMLSGPLSKKAIKLKLKIILLESKKIIFVTPIPLSKVSNNKKKRIKMLQGTTIAEIKQALVETSSTMYKILRLVGVGYRFFNVESFENKLLMLKLGYSHHIYFKIPAKLKIFCLKFTKLFISGTSYQEVTQVSSKIQFYKKPEPYKGKGILYNDEKILLKEVKKA